MYQLDGMMGLHEHHPLSEPLLATQLREIRVEIIHSHWVGGEHQFSYPGFCVLRDEIGSH